MCRRVALDGAFVAWMVCVGQLFAGGDTIQGTVASTSDTSITLKTSSGKMITIEAPREGKGSKYIQLQCGILLPGEKVTVRWAAEGDRRIIKQITGGGTLTGEIIGKGTDHLTIVPDDRDEALRFIPVWKGGSPAQGGGFDKEMLKKIAEQKIGDRVTITWKLEEHRRLLSIRPATSKPKEPRESKKPNESEE